MLEGEVKEINANKVTLKNNLLDLIELQKTQGFFHEVNNSCVSNWLRGQVAKFQCCLQLELLFP